MKTVTYMVSLSRTNQVGQVASMSVKVEMPDDADAASAKYLDRAENKARLLVEADDDAADWEEDEEGDSLGDIETSDATVESIKENS